MQVHYRSITLERGSVDTSAKTVLASLSSETPVKRWGEIEVLSHDTGSINLARAADGLPLLFAHDQRIPIGIVEDIRLSDKRLVGTLRFGTSAKAAEVWGDVEAGILRNISIGYSIEGIEDIEGGYMATRWTLLEASVVTVPADASVGINRKQTEGKNMDNDQHQAANNEPRGPAIRASKEVLAERQRASGIRSVVERLGLSSDFAEQLIEQGVSLDEARAAAIDERAVRAERDQPRTGSARFETHGNESMIRAMGEVISARFTNNQLSNEARPFFGMRMVDMAKTILEQNGHRTHWHDSASTVIERALHTTGDFPQLLQFAGQPVLQQAYQSYQGGLKRIAKASTCRDFRAKAILRLGEAPKLLKVKESGEITRGTVAEATESYSLATYARIFSISRQALINDDLDAFGNMLSMFGRAAAELEAKLLVDLLTSNPVMQDGTQLFHSSHGNLATGSSIGITSLSAARAAMRLQKGMDKETPIDVTPSYIIVPAALETTAEQYLADINASKSSDANPFSKKLELIVDPRLDAISTTAWYVASSAASVGHLEYSYLEGESGPQMITREGFDVEGMEFKCRLDFGCGVTEWRGLYKNPGA